jgi:hypothetical protein
LPNINVAKVPLIRHPEPMQAGDAVRRRVDLTGRHAGNPDVGRLAQNVLRVDSAPYGRVVLRATATREDYHRAGHGVT